MSVPTSQGHCWGLSVGESSEAWPRSPRSAVTSPQVPLALGTVSQGGADALRVHTCPQEPGVYTSRKQGARCLLRGGVRAGCRAPWQGTDKPSAENSIQACDRCCEAHSCVTSGTQCSSLLKIRTLATSSLPAPPPTQTPKVVLITPGRPPGHGGVTHLQAQT